MDLKQQLRDAGVTVHRDMTGPTGSYNGHAVCAVTRRATDEQLLEFIVTHKVRNFAFYVRMGDFVRYAIW